MSSECYISYLGHINTSGTTLSAFYSAIENGMTYTATSNLEEEEGMAKAIVAKLGPLANLPRAARIELMLGDLMTRLAIPALLRGEKTGAIAWSNRIHFVLPQQGTDPLISDEALSALCEQCELQDVLISQSDDIDLTLPDGTVVVAADACTGHEILYDSDWQDKLQRQDGTEGMIMSEGACALLLGKNKQAMCLKSSNNPLKSQLKQVKADLKDIYISNMASTKAWHNMWFDASCHLYQAATQSDSNGSASLIKLKEPGRLCGHAGVAQTLMALVLGFAYLDLPIQYTSPKVWLIVEHTQPQLWQLTRSDDELH
ncbi:hypothetical protein [Pseudoalteromonas luteoviolacea]|uniref:Beta-ketoacyl synthase N-terminal domain-containing protein n=1 Tax=Pseudoalteromonas luteoviolacea H33 TaxID=1365251 RepID=A0A166ZPH9_9GAMM|nr:hypothetical protein [Pseudoalteromonas luteoviolacea]KZN44527.1 hypothetical protein N476_05885 [Pseudoalteromonas luteoviolacea H33]KZN75329.1 hypothetical protein N477_18895 [Pseudoalteromonas luteoviolacea H33-S]